MKNQAIYQSSIISESLNLMSGKGKNISLPHMILGIRNWALSLRPFILLAQFCSLVMGEEVSALKAFNLLHTFVAFWAMLLLGGNSVTIQLCLIAWFTVTAIQCKRDGWGEE